MRNRRNVLIIGLLIAIALALASCGGGHPSKPHRSPKTAPGSPPATAPCPPNNSQMGCSLKTLPAPKVALAPVSGPEFPDVSDWQGHPNWSAAKAWQRSHGWKPYAVFKLGEYTLDPDAGYNAQQTAALGFGRAGYWFLRPVGCSTEAANMKWAGQRYGLKVLVLDDEVNGLAGYAGCIAPVLQRAGFTVVLYTAPGVWPGGSTAGVDEWIAAYGPSRVPCFVTCHVGPGAHPTILAWQFTDGAHGYPTDIPGIGRDDVNVDYGIESLGIPKPPPPPPPPDPYHYRTLTASELNVVLHYDGARKHPQKYAAYLRKLEATLTAQAHAVWVAAHKAPPTPVSWNYRNRGVRYQALWQRSLGHQIVK